MAVPLHLGSVIIEVSGERGALMHGYAREPIPVPWSRAGDMVVFDLHGYECRVLAVYWCHGRPFDGAPVDLQLCLEENAAYVSDGTLSLPVPRSPRSPLLNPGSET